MRISVPFEGSPYEMPYPNERASASSPLDDEPVPLIPVDSEADDASDDDDDWFFAEDYQDDVPEITPEMNDTVIDRTGQYEQPTSQAVSRDKPEELPPLPDAKTSGMAIASLVLGIFGGCGITAILGLILGFVARAKIRNSRGKLKGKGLALAGIIVSVLSIVGTVVGGIVAIKTFTQAVAVVDGEERIGINLNSLVKGQKFYSHASNQVFPDANDWPDQLAQYMGGSVDEFVILPYEPEAGRAIAYNATLTGINDRDIRDPARTPVFFEAAFGSPPSGGPELLPNPPRRPGGHWIGFVDGHVDIVPADQINTLVWDPVNPTPP